MNDAMVVPGRRGCIEHDTKNKRAGEQDFYHVRHCSILSRWLMMRLAVRHPLREHSDQDHRAVAIDAAWVLEVEPFWPHRNVRSAVAWRSTRWRIGVNSTKLALSGRRLCYSF